MAVQPQGESYCMEINFQPQHSKWLQGCISDVNLKLKAISRLVEEDADSFASRAEMYFKNRPQLMELVKELYRAYHTLAERYNHAARALHQTHRRVSEAFPSKIATAQIPDMTVPDTSDELQKDATIMFISDMDAKLKATIKLLEEVADSFAKRAEMYYKHRPKLMKLVEEFYRAFCTVAQQYDMVVDVLRHALHTISDAFLRETQSPLSELDAPDSPTTSGSYFEHELQSDGNHNSPNKHTVKRSATFPEEKWLRTLVESSHMAKEIDSRKDQLSSETKRANKAESEVATLSASIRRLSVARDTAEAECRAYSEKLENVESELLMAQNDMKELADGWAREVGNLQSTEKIKQSQKQELQDLKERLRELEARQFEPERNRSKQKEEEDAQKISELMDEVEQTKLETETTVWEFKKEIERLNEQNLSSEILISELENKINMLRDTNERLESEIEILRERLWIYFGKQEKMLFTTALRAGADMCTPSESFNWLNVLCSRLLDRVLRPLKSHIGAFLFSLVKAVLYIYTKFFTTQNSSEKIIKEDDGCKSRLLLKVEKPKNNEMQEQELYEMRGELYEDQMMSEEEDCENSKPILESYKEET
ncbi:uncharacterized protein LOC144559698 isoform X2 [Carex rostrata]